MRKLILAATSIAALAVPAVAPAIASATSSANQTVTVGTHSAQHADTTDMAGPGTQDSPNGPVWAYDNMNLKYAVTPQGANQYVVAIQATGSFNAFADPRTGQSWNGTGSVKGNITYLVDSPTAPNAANVPSQEPNGSGIRLGITQMFGDNATIDGNPAYGHYTFTYNQVNGSSYQQIG